MIEILNIDCVEYMKTLEDDAFDLAIVDPPYRDDNVPTKCMREKGGKMDDFGKKPGADYFEQLMRVSKNQIIWGANNFLEHLPSTNCFIFWYKKNPMSNYSDGELAWTSFKEVARCFDFDYYGAKQGRVRADTKIHPTQKPIELYSWLLDNYSAPHESILDTHLGSGSAAIAAHYNYNDFVGCELNEKYYQLAKNRIDKETRQETLF